MTQSNSNPPTTPPEPTIEAKIQFILDAWFYGYLIDLGAPESDIQKIFNSTTKAIITAFEAEGWKKP